MLKSLGAWIWSYAYPHIILNHCDSDSLKVVIRSWLTMWSLLLVTIIKGGPEHYMGCAGYLGDFAAGIEIVGGQSVIHALLVSFVNGFLVVFAFSCTVVTMAINWRLHGYPTRHSIMEDLESNGVCKHADWGCAIYQMQQGHYLSTRTTAVTIFGMFFSFTITGLAQTKSRICSLGWLLNSLTMIIVGTFNNFTPLFEPWLWGKVAVIPILTCYAVRILFAVSVFPCTSNAKFTQSLINALKESSSQGAIKKFATTEIDGQLMRFEFAYTRLTVGVLREMRSLIQLAATSAHAIEDLFEHPFEYEDHLNDEYISFELEHYPKFFRKRLTSCSKPTGRFEAVHRPYVRKALKAAEYIEHYRLCWLKAQLCLEQIITWLEECNSWRLYSSIFRYERRARTQQLRQQSLQKALEELDNLQIPVHKDNEASVYEFSARNFMARIYDLGHFCMAIDRHAPVPFWQIPLRDKTPIHVLSSESSHIYNLADPEFVFNDDSIPARVLSRYDDSKDVEKRNPDSTKPRNIFHLCGCLILRMKRTIFDPDLVFCMKRAWLTILALILYFLRPTAGFAYRYWLLWVSVLTAYTVARYAVDGTYGLVAKCIYTFWGALTSMVAWYICQNNYFGYATVMAFVYAYIVYQRHYNSHEMPSASIVFGCTAVLVAGDSWASKHLLLPGLDLNAGFKPAWIRFTAVCAGLFISFLGTIFPNTVTGKKIIRVLIANSLSHAGELQAIISNFAMRRWENPAVRMSVAKDLVVHRVRAIVGYLNSAEALRVRMHFEPPLTGHYPQKSYEILILYTRELIHLYSLLEFVLDNIHNPRKSVPEVLNHLGWTDPILTSSTFSVVHMSSQALFTGDALPSVTPAFLVGRYLEKEIPWQLEGYDERLTFAAREIVLHIYGRLDAIIIIIKNLVGELYNLNMNIYNL